MINEASASASEIFAGSMQDWDKGLVVGKTSFGKGSVQQLFPLSDGYGIKITTSKYYIHSGRGIHKEDNDRLLRGEEISESEKEKLDEERKKQVYHTDKGRIVYGGGGITPDIEIEQGKLTPFEMELRRKNLFFPFVVDYMLHNEGVVTKKIEISEQIFNKFLQFAKENGLEVKEQDLTESKKFIVNALKATFYTRQFGEKEGYMISIELDDQLQEALSLFDRFSTLDEMFAYAESLKK